jgi:hypothetical protein
MTEIFHRQTDSKPYKLTVKGEGGGVDKTTQKKDRKKRKKKKKENRSYLVCRWVVEHCKICSSKLKIIETQPTQTSFEVCQELMQNKNVFI